MGNITSGGLVAGVRLTDRLEDGRPAKEVLLEVVRRDGEDDGEDDVTTIVDWLFERGGLVVETGSALEGPPPGCVVGVPVVVLNDDDGTFLAGGVSVEGVRSALERVRRELTALGLEGAVPRLYLTWSVNP